MDIDARYPGAESWATVGGLTSAKGESISVHRPSRVNFGVYWDGDLLRELLDGTTIDKWRCTCPRPGEDHCVVAADSLVAGPA
jgi:rhamnogalacturonan endolyase